MRFFKGAVTWKVLQPLLNSAQLPKDQHKAKEICSNTFQRGKGIAVMLHLRLIPRKGYDFVCVK